LLLPYLWLARFAHPYADDLSYAAHSGGELMPRLWQEYEGWNGRMSSNILVLRGPLRNGLAEGLAAYRWMPALWTLGLLVAWYMLLGSSVFGTLMPRQRFVGASLLTLVWYNVMPDITEGLYWYTGAATYTAGSIALIVAWSGWLRLADGKGGVWTLGVGTLIATLWALFSSEVHMLLVATSVACLLAWQWHRRRLEVPVALCGIIVFAATAVMIGAPGNEVRGSLFPGRGRLGHTALMASVQVLRFVVEWMATPALAVCSVIWYTVSERFMAMPVTRVAPVIPLVVGLLLTGALMALPYWTTGMLGQHRTVNVACLFFLPCWALFLITLRRRLQLRWSVRPSVQAPMALLLAALVLGGNGGRVIGDLASGAARRNDEALMNRYDAVLEDGTLWGSVLLNAQPCCTKALRIPDPHPDPSHWVNRSMARLLGAEGVRIVGPGVTACDAFPGAVGPWVR
jgi:hypothetical protein